MVKEPKLLSTICIRQFIKANHACHLFYFRILGKQLKSYFYREDMILYDEQRDNVKMINVFRILIRNTFQCNSLFYILCP